MIGRSSIRGIAQIGNPVSGRGLSTSRGGGGVNENFEILVDTTLAGSASDTIIIPTVSGEAYDFEITWDNEGTETYTSSALTSVQHTFTTGGEKTIKISGTFPRIYFNNGGDKDKLKQIINFGSVGWSSMEGAFYGCSNLTSGGGYSDFSSVTSFYFAFRNCTSLTTLDVSAWNTSAVTSFSNAFYDCISLTTLDVSLWDTSSVTNFGTTFRNCASLTTLDVSGWNTSAVTNFSNAFYDCISLKIDASSFDMTSVTNVTNMFYGCNINETGTTTNYDNTLIAWAAQDLVNSLSIHFGTSQYSETGETAKNAIIADDLWTFTDGGLAT